MLTTPVVLIIMAAVIGSTVSVAGFAWIVFRLRALQEGRLGSGELLSLHDEVDSLREELRSTHSDISDLSERLDFAERLLLPKSESDES